MSDRYTIARITQNGEHFEILTKPDKAFDFKLGKGNSTISEVIAADIIFTDAGKGTKSSEEKLQQKKFLLHPNSMNPNNH